MYLPSLAPVLSLALCLLSSHGSAAPLEGQGPHAKSSTRLLTRQSELPSDKPAARPKGPPSSVFRGDGRGPDKIKAAGGFLPHSDMPPEGPAAYGLYNHVWDAIVDESTRKRDTVYVSTSASFGVAANFAASQRPESRWVYHIAATPKMVDVNASLPAIPNFSDSVRYEAEYAAAGGIHWSQMKGWLLLPADFTPAVLFDENDEVDLTNSDFAALSHVYVKNEDYDSKWDAYTASGPQPQLAGLVESSKDEWATQKPWSDFRGKSVQEYLTEFLKVNGAAVGWRDFSPLFSPPQDARKTEQEATDEAKAEDRGKQALQSSRAQAPTPTAKSSASGSPVGNVDGPTPDPLWDGPNPDSDWDGPRPDTSWNGPRPDPSWNGPRPDPSWNGPRPNPGWNGPAGT